MNVGGLGILIIQSENQSICSVVIPNPLTKFALLDK
jgi:hypothetical protein